MGQTRAYPAGGRGGMCYRLGSGDGGMGGSMDLEDGGRGRYMRDSRQATWNR